MPPNTIEDDVAVLAEDFHSRLDRVRGDREAERSEIERTITTLRKESEEAYEYGYGRGLEVGELQTEDAVAEARDQEAKFWFETWYSHYIAPKTPMAGEFGRFATERIQMTGYERDQATPDTK